MYRLSQHARRRVQYGDSELRRTLTSPHQVQQLFSRSKQVVRHCEYHVVYAPYDMECLGAIIRNNVIVTIVSDHQIPWLLPKLLAKRRYGIHAVGNDPPVCEGLLSNNKERTLIEVVAALDQKQKTVYSVTMFNFSEQWFKSRWLLRILADAITHARNEPHTSISVIYRTRGRKEYAPIPMILELLDDL